MILWPKPKVMLEAILGSFHEPSNLQMGFGSLMSKGKKETLQCRNKILDCLSNAGTLALGHNHPLIRKEMQNFLDEEKPFQTLDLATETKDRFIKTLFKCVPEDRREHTRVQFCGPAGTDAVEAAIKMCKIATGRLQQRTC